MKCLECQQDNLNDSDIFCPYCGSLTSFGYSFLKNENNVKKIMSGKVFKQNNRLTTLIITFIVFVILFLSFYLVKGEDLFKPVIYLKNVINNYAYGFNTSPIKTDNIYLNEEIFNIDDAKDFIKKDFDTQKWLCSKNTEVSKLEYFLEDTYLIPSVSFCNMSYDNAKKIYDVINKMYILFPNIKGNLTNITITNAKTKDEYIAYFQPLYQFVNTNLDINEYNKVNKSQILINSYYFLNDKYLQNSLQDVVGNDFYIDNANWYSTIAHEFGHYISFVTFLKQKNINITFVTKENEQVINNYMNDYNNGNYSKEILLIALKKYNEKYNCNYDLISFAKNISKYASTLDSNKNLIYDETIAEAIHDYYVNGNNLKKESKEIVDVILERLS